MFIIDGSNPYNPLSSNSFQWCACVQVFSAIFFLSQSKLIIYLLVFFMRRFFVRYNKGAHGDSCKSFSWSLDCMHLSLNGM